METADQIAARYKALANADLARALDQQAGRDPKDAHPEVRGACLMLAEAAKRIREMSAPTLAGVEAESRSAEARFIDQDLFVAYVAEKVNPERAAQGLETVGDGAARHLYDVITTGRYR